MAGPECSRSLRAGNQVRFLQPDVATGDSGVAWFRHSQPLKCTHSAVQTRHMQRLRPHAWHYLLPETMHDLVSTPWTTSSASRLGPPLDKSSSPISLLELHVVRQCIVTNRLASLVDTANYQPCPSAPLPLFAFVRTHTKCAGCSA